MENFKYLGHKVNAPSKQLDTFEKPANVTVVKFESNELTGFCPVTHQPDFYKISIEFEPDKLCIESKSLKLYLWSFRNEAIFAEGMANIIVDDIYKVIKPVWCKVTLIQNVRGGLELSVVAERKRDNT
jgi:7-cyano-7-deazaguanine reductase